MLTIFKIYTMYDALCRLVEALYNMWIGILIMYGPYTAIFAPVVPFVVVCILLLLFLPKHKKGGMSGAG
ncbi:MAG TPA: hypothetical protein VD928_03545 [Candidatus Paceibacterota bacterium]|nr:hypothetical protein [Candidatus Paceibacterota bacterium]